MFFFSKGHILNVFDRGIFRDGLCELNCYTKLCGENQNFLNTRPLFDLDILCIRQRLIRKAEFNLIKTVASNNNVIIIFIIYLSI